MQSEMRPEVGQAPVPPQVRLATFGVGDTMMIVVIALIVFGPKRLPEISKQIGKLLYEFRKASNDFKFQIEEELRASEQAERQKQLAAQAAAPQPATPVALAAGESVSAEPVSSGLSGETSAETGQSSSESTSAAESPATPEAGLVIQPPTSGAPVSTRSPYRAIAEAAEPASDAQAESLDELQANAQEAVRTAAADPSYMQPTNAPVPTHHG